MYYQSLIKSPDLYGNIDITSIEAIADTSKDPGPDGTAKPLISDSRNAGPSTGLENQVFYVQINGDYSLGIL